MSENTLKQSKIDMVLERFMRNYKINLLISLSLLILIIGFLFYFLNIVLEMPNIFTAWYFIPLICAFL